MAVQRCRHTPRRRVTAASRTRIASASDPANAADRDIRSYRALDHHAEAAPAGMYCDSWNLEVVAEGAEVTRAPFRSRGPSAKPRLTRATTSRMSPERQQGSR